VLLAAFVADQRRHEVCAQVLATTRPLIVSPLVLAELDYLAVQLADAQLLDGTPLSADELIKVALEAKILPALFDVAGQLGDGGRCGTPPAAVSRSVPRCQPAG
jgi:hypothetical protein